jgi:hypothetical protein
VAVGEEEADTVRKENTLLHRETLLVVTTSDTEDVALPLIADRIGGDLLGNALVVEDTAERCILFSWRLFPSVIPFHILALLIVDVDELLGTRGRVCECRVIRKFGGSNVWDGMAGSLAMLSFMLS